MAKELTEQEKAEAKVKEEAKINAEAKIKAQADAEAKAKEEADAKAKAEAGKKAKLHDEARKLGITRTKVRTQGAKVKDGQAEAVRHEKLADKRLENRIKKAKAPKKSKQQIRKEFLLAKLSHRQDFPKAQIAQARWELDRMDRKKWKAGQRMPRRKSVYDEIME